jgi:hypothetical protein
MHTPTRILTAIATLAAVLTLAVAIGPAASAALGPPPGGLSGITKVAPTGNGGTIAKENNGKYQDSAEAKRKKFCADLKGALGESKANLKRAMWRGDKNAQKEIGKSVFGLQVLIEGNGC